MNFRTIGDLNKKDKKKHPKTTESYIGGEKSGLAVENPGDPLSDIVNQAKKNSQGGSSFLFIF